MSYRRWRFVQSIEQYVFSCSDNSELTLIIGEAIASMLDFPLEHIYPSALLPSATEIMIRAPQDWCSQHRFAVPIQTKSSEPCPLQEHSTDLQNWCQSKISHQLACHWNSNTISHQSNCCNASLWHYSKVIKQPEMIAEYSRQGLGDDNRIQAFCPSKSSPVSK